MKRLFIQMILMAAFLSCSESGSKETTPANIYIDPSISHNGNGTFESPFNSFKGISLEAGKNYLIKRGTALHEEILINASGGDSTPITLASYGEGPLPVITGSEIETGWLLHSGSVFKKNLGTSSTGNASCDGIMLSFVKWSGDPSSIPAGSFTIDQSSSVIFIRTRDGSSPDFHRIECSRRYFGISGTGVSNIQIKDLHITGTSLHGMHFKNCSNISISKCIVEKSGGAYITPSINAGNGIEFGNSSSKCTVAECSIRDIFDSGISPQIYDCSNSASDFTFSNLTVERCGFAGIEIAILSQGGNTCSLLSGVSILDSKIISSGKGWSGVRYGTEGRGIKVAADSGAGKISSVSIAGCEIYGSANEGIYVYGDSGEISVTRTSLHGNRDGITAAGGSAPSLKIKMSSSLIYGNSRHGVVYNVTDGNGFELINNTFLDNGEIGFTVLSPSPLSVIKNCIFHSTISKAHLYSASSLNGRDIDYNLFYDFGNGIIGYNGISYDSISTYSGSTGNDLHSIDSDPLLNNDLSIDEASPCRNKGCITYVTSDYSGNNFLTPPSIGAFR